jgi:hypothetical protein
LWRMVFLTRVEMIFGRYCKTFSPDGYSMSTAGCSWRKVSTWSRLPSLGTRDDAQTALTLINCPSSKVKL